MNECCYHGATSRSWLAWSPDLNPIDNLCDILDWRVRQRHPPCQKFCRIVNSIAPEMAGNPTTSDPMSGPGQKKMFWSSHPFQWGLHQIMNELIIFWHSGLCLNMTSINHFCKSFQTSASPIVNLPTFSPKFTHFIYLLRLHIKLE